MHLNWAEIVTDHGLIAATETTPHPPFQKLLISLHLTTTWAALPRRISFSSL
jgi:hypothetical protein